MDETSKIINQENLVAQIQAFNFNVLEVDGHDVNEIDDAINNLLFHENNKPGCIVANTIKGKGIQFMENKNDWHYLRLDQSLYEQALRELEL